MSAKLPLCLLASMALPIFALAQDQPTPKTDEFFIHDGDMPVVFLGDSITEQKMYSTLIEAYTLSRFPTWKVNFRNVGWSGDRAELSSRGGVDFDGNFQRDVLTLQPKAITIDYGMNDARGGDTYYKRFIEYSTKLVENSKKAGARVALLTPSPEEKYEDDAPAGSHYNLMLKKYADGLKEIADKENVLFIDQLTPFINFIDEGRKAGILSKTEPPKGDKDFEQRLMWGDIHPNWGGHLIMATVILQGMHAPALVSSVSLDAEARSTIATEKCTIEWQEAPHGVVQFKRTDETLPWPTVAEGDVALKIPGFDPATALNLYTLKVSNLKEPSYKLSIDDKNFATYSNTDLAAGVNLSSVREGPIYDQAQRLLRAIMQKNKDFYHRWREVQLAPSPAKPKDGATDASDSADSARTAELARLDGVIADDEKAIDALRHPIPHIFRLEPVSTK